MYRLRFHYYIITLQREFQRFKKLIYHFVEALGIYEQIRFFTGIAQLNLNFSAVYQKFTRKRKQIRFAIFHN